MSLDGFSMYPLVKELNHALVGGRIDKISQPNKQTVLLSIRQPGRNHSLHISINPQNAVVNLNERTLENPPEPPIFCMVLRKQIEGGRIADIRQHSLDRIILIDIDVLSAGGIILTKTLIIELMGKYSNIILICDGTIIDSLRKVGTTSSRVRLVLPGLSYSLPPNQDKFNVLDEPPKNILATIKEFPNLKLSKALLNTCLGFGPVTAKEIAFSAGLPANMLVSDLKEADGAAILNALQKIITAFLANDIHPTIVMDTHRKLLAMASFALHTPENAITQTFPSVSIMLDYSVQLSGNYVVPDKDRFKKLVHNELARAKNKINILTDELATAQKAEDYKIKADNIMTYQYTLKDHANKEITVSNIYSETN
ncbi:MAG: NFACT family protein, partial [Selenomonadaceae bacterium]